MTKKRKYNEIYYGPYLDHIEFPLGGFGSGMICIEGTATFSHFSIRNKPEFSLQPLFFSGISIKDKNNKSNIARIIEGSVPDWKISARSDAGSGLAGTTYGLPRFRNCSFKARFPFAFINLKDKSIPVEVEITAWSPFIPDDADNSGLPSACIEYNFINKSNRPLECVYSFNSENFLAKNDRENLIKTTEDGFILYEDINQDSNCLYAGIHDEKIIVNPVWFRGWIYDTLTILWNDIKEGNCKVREDNSYHIKSKGATIYVPFKIEKKQSKKISLIIVWYAPHSDLSWGKTLLRDKNSAYPEKYKPYYTVKFKSIYEIIDYLKNNYEQLKNKTLKFTKCLYSSTLPPEVLEAVTANLTILKSPTILRQHDGRIWGWEGCNENSGCCAGSCTHVYNYAQTVAHLFPSLERGLRETEFNESQDEDGQQTFRTGLPIRKIVHEFIPAADGQFGGIMKIYREWRISGDTDWLKNLWPKVKKSLDYCIRTWDPEKKGILNQPHHNTYDIEFWGPDSLCMSFYLSALKSAILISEFLGDDYTEYKNIFEKGIKYFEKELFNGKYFFQKIFKCENPQDGIAHSENIKTPSPEIIDLIKDEGPKYQYGTGCLSDGITGLWLAWNCFLPEFIDRKKILKHLKSVFKYNFRKSFYEHENTQRPSYAYNDDKGLLLCSWPDGKKPSLPFIYSDEVWTGIEYVVAGYLIKNKLIKEGLEIIRAVRDRYNGKKRNPFDEYECGHWYARAMSSYSLLLAFSGVRYDAVEKTFYIEPVFKGDFKIFFSTQGSFGLAGIFKGKPFLKLYSGPIEINKLIYKNKEIKDFEIEYIK